MSKSTLFLCIYYAPLCIFIAYLLIRYKDTCLDCTFSKGAVAADSEKCSEIGLDTCPDGTFSKGAVAADSEKCSEIGLNILQEGGSAVDAAIAALLCTSIINPQSAGIGGGSIFTIMNTSGYVTIINSRETVPANVTNSLLDSCPYKDQPMEGKKWIGVPGEIRGYEEAHKRYGKLPWENLFKPAIDLARNRTPIPHILGLYIPSIANTPLRKLFSDENGNLLKTGDNVTFENLSVTLEMIAEHGADVFYNGRIAEDLIRDIEQAGGALTLQDLASYKVTVTDAWVVPLGEYQMYFPPPPAGGAIVSLILNIMKGYKMNSEPETTDEKILFYHRYTEALKFTSGLKRCIRDPNFNSDEFTPTAKNFTEESFADHIRSLITDESHDDQYYNLPLCLDSISYRTLNLESTGTTHVSVLAEDGSAVSVTSSINNVFGSKFFSPSTGIILNNQLSDFCGRADRISPGERPPSNTAPAVLKSKSKTLVVGGSGGKFIKTGMASALMNHLWFGKSLKEAIDTPVVYVDSKNLVEFELRSEKDVINALKAKGHKIEKFYNVVNAVEKEENGCISAYSDERKNGKAAGY